MPTTILFFVINIGLSYLRPAGANTFTILETNKHFYKTGQQDTIYQQRRGLRVHSHQARSMFVFMMNELTIQIRGLSDLNLACCLGNSIFVYSYICWHWCWKLSICPTSTRYPPCTFLYSVLYPRKLTCKVCITDFLDLQDCTWVQSTGSTNKRQKGGRRERLGYQTPSPKYTGLMEVTELLPRDPLHLALCYPGSRNCFLLLCLQASEW